jgi:peptidoglycan lytic transglycosylase
MPVICLLMALCAAQPSDLPGAAPFLEGHLLQNEGHYARAVDQFDACIQIDGPLRPYAEIRHAACRGETGNRAAAIDELRAFLKRERDLPWTPLAEVTLARLLQREKRHVEAVRHYRFVLEANPRPWWMAHYAWRAADNALEVPDETALAFAFYRDVVENTPWRAERLDAAERLAKSPDPEGRFLSALTMLRYDRFKAAKVTSLSLAPFAVGDAEHQQRWEYLKARVAIGMGAATEGRKSLETLIESAPDSPWAPSALHFLARSYAADRKNAPAYAALERLANTYPESDDAGEALWWMARRRERSAATQDAVAWYLQLAEACPDHARADDALFAAGSILERQGKWAQASAAYQRLASRYTNSYYAPTAALRRGEILLEQGQTDRGRAMLTQAAESRLGHYATHRALARIADPDAQRDDALIAAGLPFLALRTIPPPSVDTDDQSAALRRMLFFALNGCLEAEWEALAWCNESAPFNPQHYDQLSRAGLAYTARRILFHENGNTLSELQSPELLRVLHPRAHWKQVKQLGGETGIDPYLILAVGLQESTFRSAVVSHVGATGVMQVMPPTAKWLAKVDPAISARQARHLNSPCNSLHIGAYYLKRLLTQYDGNVVHTLAAYNAGPGNVNKWRKSLPKNDLPVFIDRIPFSETRDFVQRVLGNYAAYRSLYPPVE